MKHAATKPKTYATQAAFAAALCVSKATMSRYVRREDWPVSRVGPWTLADLGTVLRWQAEYLQEDRAREAHEGDAGLTAADLAAMERTVEDITGMSYSDWVRSVARDWRQRADEFEAELKAAASAGAANE